MSDSNTEDFLTIRDLWSKYGDYTALEAINLSIREGEFVAIVGPSGSGKSSLLMVLAGFAHPSRGIVTVAGRDLLSCPPHKREIGFVFQNYALFPHMSVLGNVMYPLDARKVPRSEARERALESLERVGLREYAGRAIGSLSGGQRQRVALARALVAKPRIVLMDEPLSALDKGLREDMQAEIRGLHDRLGFTTLYVTHDQREALMMADRVAVMNRGKLQQTGTPEQIYRRPESRFVASFMGHANLLPLEFLRRVHPPPFETEAWILQGKTHGLLRAEDLHLSTERDDTTALQFDALLERASFQGESWLWHLRLEDGIALRALIPGSLLQRLPEVACGTRVRLTAAMESLCFIRAEDHGSVGG